MRLLNWLLLCTKVFLRKFCGLQRMRLGLLLVDIQLDAYSMYSCSRSGLGFVCNTIFSKLDAFVGVARFDWGSWWRIILIVFPSLSLLWQPTQELRESFKIKHYLYLTKVFEEVTEEKSRDKEQRKVSGSIADPYLLKVNHVEKDTSKLFIFYQSL